MFTDIVIQWNVLSLPVSLFGTKDTPIAAPLITSINTTSHCYHIIRDDGSTSRDYLNTYFLLLLNSNPFGIEHITKGFRRQAMGHGFGESPLDWKYLNYCYYYCCFHLHDEILLQRTFRIVTIKLVQSLRDKKSLCKSMQSAKTSVYVVQFPSITQLVSFFETHVNVVPELFWQCSSQWFTHLF